MLWGLFGQPYIDLAGLVDTSAFPALDQELCEGLARVEVGVTGGTLKWMGVTAPWTAADGYRDAMHIIEALPLDEWRAFVALAADPASFDPALRRSYRFGDETDHPFTAQQARWLAYRHGAYFPWKVCYHLLENHRWEDKHAGADKAFTAEARAVFPLTVAFIEALPFTEVGRVVLFGLQPNDHAPSHRDSEPGQSLSVAQSISFAPRPGKRFFLTSPDGAEEVAVTSSVYWFNDMDWHGVKADPFFRYSLRVDGVFAPGFAAEVERRARGVMRAPASGPTARGRP